METITIRPLSDAVGAVIGGVDLRQLSDAEFSAIKSAFHQHGAIFFRNQSLDPDDHIAFAKRWGDININRFFHPVEGHPEIAEVLKSETDTLNIGGAWHTDHSYDQIPALGSILKAIDVPEVGGDTLFAGMSAAYDALSDGFKDMLGDLSAEHGNAHVFGPSSTAYANPDAPRTGGRIGNPEAAGQEAIHPVVIAHPDTGRPGLYVNPGFTTGIVGWNRAESDMLLHYLYNHIAQPRFTARFHWEPGSVAMWDNRSTWHNALNDYQGRRRYMHRITVEGVPITSAA